MDNAILNISIYKATELVVCGLLFLGANKCFLIDAIDQDEEGFFIECPWNIDFL